jgi:hypothetical protein
MTLRDRQRRLGGRLRRARVDMRRTVAFARSFPWPLAWTIWIWAAVQASWVGHLNAAGLRLSRRIRATESRLQDMHRPGRRRAFSDAMKRDH